MTAKIPVRSSKSITKDSTHIALMVDSISQEEINPFDPEKIKKALLDIDLTEEQANDITLEVQEKVMSIILIHGFKSVDTAFIRAFVNLVLLDKGYTKQLKSIKEYTISHEDIKQLIENENNENGNTEHNPESINLTIAEAVQKDYLFKNVFSKDVVKSHLEGKIHLHDAGYLRAYSYDGNTSNIAVKIDDKEMNITLKQFYELFSNTEHYDSSWDAFIEDLKDKNIYTKDKDGWVKVTRALRHKDKDDLINFVFENNTHIAVTKNHPCIVFDNNEYIIKEASSIGKEDVFIGIV